MKELSVNCCYSSCENLENCTCDHRNFDSVKQTCMSPKREKLLIKLIENCKQYEQAVRQVFKDMFQNNQGAACQHLQTT